MSLQVWLPLNGDLHNQGLSDLSFSIISDTNTKLDNNGKIGKCYNNDSHTAGGLISDKTIELGQQQSMFCWFKFTDLYSGASLGGSLISQHRTSTYTGMGITIRYVSATTGYLSVSTGNGSSRTYNTYYGTTLLQANTWYHGGYTYDGSTIKIYVNGICEKTQAFSGMSVPADYISCFCWNLTGTSGNTIQANYKLQGSLNDIRIYDHCLSPMEVKELSKGLVLHYPLNRGGWGQENLLRGTYDWQYWTFSSRTSKTNDEATLTGSTADWSAAIHSAHLDKSLLDGTTTYTWSFEYSSTATWACNPVIGGTATGVDTTSASRTKYTYWQKAINLSSTDGKWKKYVLTPRTIAESQMTSGSGDVNCWFLQIYNRTDNVAVKIRRIKLEKGSIATPWSPNLSDTLATTLGLNDMVEYDTSGYCNNLTKNGIYSYTSDAPKYAVSTTFNGTEWMNGSTPGAEIKTLACWAKTTKNKSTSQFMVADSTSAIAIAFYSGCIIGVFGSTRSTGSKCTLGSSYKENDWNHFVVVKTGDAGERAIYCNGELLTPTSNDYWSSATGLFIGGRNNSGALPFYGQICDVRAYATALSAEDVKSLYQNSAYIDSSGNVYGAVHSEV